MTDPIKDDKDLTELQRKADQQKGEWPDAEEADEDAVTSPDNLQAGVTTPAKG